MISAAELRKVSMVYLIKGGNSEDRKTKKNQILADYNTFMYRSYEEGDEIAIVFSVNNSDFDGMTFKEAKQIAGENDLGPNYRNPYAIRNVFGIIDLSATRDAEKKSNKKYTPL